MQGFYSADQYDYEVEYLMELGFDRDEAMAAVEVKEKQDYEEFAQWKREQDEIARLEEEAMERDLCCNDNWYEDQYDIVDF
jgi:hypothetical protein